MNKLFRVFFSSTFSDFVDERNALHKEVFPKLKELCAAYGARFQPIDLRWGIPNEVALQQSTMQICLDEIRRCQEKTPQPNFLVFLGNRYGWTPPPVRIPKTEYDWISTHFSEEERAEIEKWYREDENELCRLEDGSSTTVYELQPRGEEYEVYEKWEPVEIKLRSILLRAARKANLSETEMVKYYASATHQEIIEGVLNVEDADTHVHCFFRTLTGVHSEESAKFKETNPESIQHLSSLKDNLRNHLSSTNHDYAVDFKNNREKEEYLQKFCNDIHASLKSTIQQELDAMEVVSALEEEIHAHIEFAKERTKVFVGREDIIQDIIEYVKNNSRIPFVVYGRPGSGKSALIAKAFDRIQKENLDTEVILRFVGTSIFSSDSVALLRSICEQLVDRLEIPWRNDIPFEYNKLKNTFLKILNSIHGGKKVVLLIDALDQMLEGDKGRDLAWLPSELPNNVKIITTYATDDTYLENIMEKKLSNSLHALKSLTREDGSQALDILLNYCHRRLTPEQKQVVLNKFENNGLPLYLKLAFEQARYWNSYDAIEQLFLASDIDGVIQSLLERLYIEHTKEIVDRILCYITSARNGLTEDEILGIMTSDSEFFEWYKNKTYHDLPGEELPWIVWSRLHSDIEPYLTERGIDKTSTIAFFHRQFDEYVTKEILVQVQMSRHQILANYFEVSPMFFQKKTTRLPNYRKASEWNYHLLKTKSWKKLEENLTRMEFIDAKCSAEMTLDLQNDFMKFFEDLKSDVTPEKYDEYYDKVNEFQLFVSNQSHLIRIYSQKYPLFTAQQAINQSNKSSVCIAGRNYLASLNSPISLFEWKNKSKVQYPSILTFTGHTSDVLECVFSKDGTQLLSTSLDKTLKIWDVQTGMKIRTFNLESSSYLNPTYSTGCTLYRRYPFSRDMTRIVSWSVPNDLKLWNVETGKKICKFERNRDMKWLFDGGIFTPDGTRFLTYTSRELHLWDVQSGKLIRMDTLRLKGIMSCEFSPDGTQILTVLGDKTLKLLDFETRKPIRTFKGHTDLVIAGVFSPDGTKFLTASVDKTLKLWDIRKRSAIRTFTGHSDIVRACAFSPDGTKILSASDDKTLKLWDVKTGKIIHTFFGHTKEVRNCAFSPDGNRFISASADHTLKLWDVETREETQSSIHSDEIVSCAVSSDSIRVLSASSDKTLKLWDVGTGREIHTFTEVIRTFIPKTGTIPIVDTDDNVVTGLFSPDRKKILTVTKNNLKLWDTDTRELIQTFDEHKIKHREYAFSPDGNQIFLASKLEHLYTYDDSKGKSLCKFHTSTGHSSSVISCAFSPDGTKILSIMGESPSTVWRDGKAYRIGRFIKLWDVKKRESHIIKERYGNPLNRTEKSDIYDKSGHFTGREDVRLASDNRVLKLWEVKTGIEILTFSGHLDRVNSCAFSPDGKQIISASKDKTLKLWDVFTGKEIRTFNGHVSEVYGCIFSPDGTRILSSSLNNTLKLWDAHTGRLIHTFSDSGQILGFAFSLKGNQILSYTVEKALKLWDVDTGQKLMIFPTIADILSLSVGRKGVVACGDSAGHVYILQLIERNSLTYL